MNEDAGTVLDSLRLAAETGESFDPALLLLQLAGLSETDARVVIERLATEKGAGAVPLLAKLASSSPGKPGVWAVEALATIKDPSTADALQQLSSGAEGGQVRKAARRGLHRLATQGIVPATAPPPARAEESPDVASRCLASPIDGAGNRVLWFGLEEGGQVQMLGLLLNDVSGIRDMIDSEMSRARFDQEATAQLQNEDLPWVEMPLDYCRHLVEEAHRLNRAAGTPLPGGYLVWRDRIGKPHQQYPQPLVYSVLNAAEIRWDPRYLDRSGELLDLEMFRLWLLPREELEESVRERASARQSGLLLVGGSTEARDRLEVDRAIQKLFDDRRRSLYRRRLEEMAYHLWLLGRIERAKMALAAALAFDPPDRSLQGNPFVRQMVAWNIEVAVAAMGDRAREVRPGVRLHLPY